MLIDLIKRKFRSLIFRFKTKKSLYFAFLMYYFSNNRKYESFKNFKKIFIFVCFTNKLTLSHKEYMRCMSKAGYKIVYVNNSETNFNDLEFLNSICTLAFDRKNISRCMGGYKDIFLYLYEKSLIQKVDFLCFANDSVQFIPGKNSENLILEIDDFERRNFSALFTHKSFEGGPHYQSFFHIPTKEVFLRKDYIDFWKSYKLVNNKNFLIKNGEIELSRRFYNQLSEVKILYSTYSLAKNFDLIKSLNDEELSKIDINTLIPSISRTKTFGIKNSAIEIITNNSFLINYKNQFKFGFLYEIIEHSNSTHTAAFLYPIFLQCPFLKYDLAFNGTFSIGRVCFLYKKCLEYSLPPDRSKLIDQLSEEYSKVIFKKGIPYGNYHNQSKDEFNQGFVYSVKKT